MKAALVVTWTIAVPGRERQSIDYAREVDEFWGKQAVEGHCSEPEWFWASHGLSTWIVKGEYEQLLMLMAMPEAQRLMMMGRLLVQDFTYQICIYGREEMVAPFEALTKQLQLA